MYECLTSLYSNLRISKLGLTEQQLQSITPNFEFDIEQTEERVRVEIFW